jgi:uncharacterized membrane protein
VYALVTMRSVRGESDEFDKNVPALSVWAAGVLALLCVGFFVFYIHHVAQSIRAVVVIRRIADETRRSLKKLYPEGIGEDSHDPVTPTPPGVPSAVLTSPREGIIERVDEEALFKAAQKADVVLRLGHRIGGYVPEGAPLFEVWGDASRLDAKAVVNAVALAHERNLDQDTAFGFRQLVDLAERALSPSTNDPSTAVQVLDQLHDLLRRLGRRRFPAPFRQDEDGHLRLVLPRPDFGSYVHLALDEIRQYGSGSSQVLRRAWALVNDLLRVVPAHRRAELERQRALLAGEVERSFAEPADRRQVDPDRPEGSGPGAFGAH